MRLEFDDIDASNDGIWESGWQAKILAGIKALGFSSISEFLARFPAEPYAKLAKRLGEHVAELQIIWMQFDNNLDDIKYREAAKDCISRELNHTLKRGWGIGKNLEFRNALVYTEWSGWVTRSREDLEPVLDAVWQELLRLNPPLGWRPSGPDDPLIEAAFSRAWEPTGPGTDKGDGDNFVDDPGWTG